MIDWDRVMELRNEIGAEDFAEVVEMFLEEADEVAEKIETDLSPDAVESALHFLKGSALNLGFRELAKLCQAGEKAAAAGNVDRVGLGRVTGVYEQSKNAFKAGKERYAA